MFVMVGVLVIKEKHRFRDFRQQQFQRAIGETTHLSSSTPDYTSTEAAMTSTQKGRMSPYRGQFLLWDFYKRPAFGPDVPATTDRYFVYRCDQGQMAVCGGWADRIKGLVVSYLLANLTGRVFKAQILKPDCELTHYLQPNRVNWSLPQRDFPKDEKFQIYTHPDDHVFKSHMHEFNFSKEFNASIKHVYFLGNLEDVTNLMKNTKYTSQLAWGRGLTPADVYAAVYKRLFKLHPRLQMKLQKILFNTLKTSNHRLICVHVRMGKTKTIPTDTETRNTLGNLPRIWDFVRNHSQSEFDRVYVMSDSEEVMTSAMQQSFKDRLVTVPGDIVHVDKQLGQKTERMCSGFEKLVLEHHLLMNCDVMVRGHSGLSVIASAIRATDRDLYCLHSDGAIVPCVRNDFSTFF